MRLLSGMTLSAVLRRMKIARERASVRGFRSSFRDWASETTSFPSEVVEMALAHAIKSKVEAAYRRGDLLERRRDLMEAWAKFCEPSAAGNVVAKSRAQTSPGRSMQGVSCRIVQPRHEQS